jgi:hypothetical protein
MERWDYAVFMWESSDKGDSRWVRFTDGTKWEPIRGGDYLSTLQRLGNEGWELVNITFSNITDNNLVKTLPHTWGQVAYFKRRLP